MPWDECGTPGEFTPDGDLWCAGGFGWDGTISYWLEVCAESSACSDGLTFCDKATWGTDGVHGVCVYNFCGDEQMTQGGSLKNGGNWGSCDSEVAFPADASAGSGQCVPFDGRHNEVFLCIPGGQTPVGGTCRFDTDPRAAEACTALSICVSRLLRATECTTNGECDPLQVCSGGRCADKSCATDGDCGDTGYCFDDGSGDVCRPLGKCSELCNAGLGDAPICTSTEEVCIGGLTNRPDFYDARGYCGEPGCDVLGGPDECPEVSGEPGMCMIARSVKDHPFMGFCGIQPDEVLAMGDACGFGDVCEQGTLCIGSQVTGAYACRGLCECLDADWVSGICMTEAAQCAFGESCAYFGGTITLGACIPD